MKNDKKQLANLRKYIHVFLVLPIIVFADSEETVEEKKAKPSTLDIGIFYDRSRNKENGSTKYRGQTKAFVNYMKMDLDPFIPLFKSNISGDSVKKRELLPESEAEYLLEENPGDEDCSQFLTSREFEVQIENEKIIEYNNSLKFNSSSLFEFNATAANDNRTTGLDDENDYTGNFAFGTYNQSNVNSESYYDPDDLDRHNFGTILNAGYSEINNEDFNLELFYKYRKLFYTRKAQNDGVRCTVISQIKNDMRIGITGKARHDRDFSNGSTVELDWSYRWGDFSIKREFFFGPRIVASHFFSDRDSFKDETTLSFQINGDFKIPEKIKGWEFRFQPTIGYEKIYNHLGDDDELSSLFGLIAIVARRLSSDDLIAGGRRGGGRYYRP